MERKLSIKGLFLSTVVLFVSVTVICGSFVYGRIIGSHYRTSIEVTANEFAEDVNRLVDEARDYLESALGLAENPQ